MKLAGHWHAANRKIVDGSLRLRTPPCLGRNLQFTHAVTHSAKRLLTHLSDSPTATLRNLDGYQLVYDSRFAPPSPAK